jgi:hypothetical protein
MNDNKTPGSALLRAPGTKTPGALGAEDESDPRSSTEQHRADGAGPAGPGSGAPPRFIDCPRPGPHYADGKPVGNGRCKYWAELMDDTLPGQPEYWRCPVHGHIKVLDHDRVPDPPC